MDDSAVERLLVKYPLLERQRDRLAAMCPGAFCFHRTFGFGEIAEYDENANKIVVDFHGMPHHAIDPIFAIKHLAVLPEDHLLVRFKKDPEAVKSLLRDDPAGAMRAILANFPGNRATQAEIGDILQHILGEKGLKTWWTRAKKEAELDSQIAEPEQRGGYYVLRTEPLEQIDELLDSVIVAKQIAKKIQAAEKLLADKKFQEQTEKMTLAYNELLRLYGVAAASGVEKLQLYWLCEDFAAALGLELPGAISLDASLRSVDELAEIANSLSASQLSRLFEAIAAFHGDNFFPQLLAFVKNCTGRAVNCAVDFIEERGKLGELEITLQNWLRESAMRASLLDWIIRNRKSKRYGAIVTPLICSSLFRLALSAIDQEALKRNTNRKIPLAEAIAADRGLVDEILNGEGQEMAQDLAQMVLANQGFDFLTKRSIVARFIGKFNDLHRLLDDGTARHGGDGGTLKVSQESLENVRRDYEQLVTVRIPANTAAVEAAREEGDLRENSMYKMARQEQDMLLALKSQMEKDLSRVQVVDFSSASGDVASIGSAVTLVDGKGKKERIVILGAWDSNPDKKIIAYLTPLGRNILGKRVGDSVSVDGRDQRTISSIERWVDIAAK
ncbi:MAG: GreA/GreB family elongation factor [Puniceicoccales bacterium]|jgi:transcription elongation GreA/GreB family factor|nr:GreA/GreB family elongation factor [Puniceicoccales bacterium]